MKVRALPIITLVLASSSVQAQDGSESMMSPITDLNPATVMVVPIKMMTEMMVIPMKMMVGMMAVPVKVMEEIMVAPTGMINAANMIDPATMSQQTSAAAYGIPTYDTFAAPAQAELTGRAAPAL